MHPFSLVAIAVVFCILQSQSSRCAESPADLAAKGAEALNLSQSEPDAIVPAAIFYGKASAAYVLAGDDENAREMNSCLYWCKKKMTLAQMDVFLKRNEAGASEAIASFKALEKIVVPVSESKTYFDRADAFAKKYPKDFLLVAVRYFEVADRFPESPEGRSAMQLSLAAMQKISTKAKPSEYKPTPTDGKIFIQSEPPGASIILVQDGIKRDTGKKSPGLVQLPLGYQTLELELKGYKVGNLSVTVDDKAIAKPGPLKLNPITAQVEVLYEEERLVFIDGVGMPQKTPCILEIPMGIHTVYLAKEGFQDIAQQVEIRNSDRATLEPKGKPVAGVSAILKSIADKKQQTIKEFVGKWRYLNPEWMNFTLDFHADGTFGDPKSKQSGKWYFEEDMVVVSWIEWGTFKVKKVDKNNYANGKEALKR